MNTSKKRREKGSALIEFTLCSLIWLPLLIGTAMFGINIVQAIQVSALSRDAGHMYAYGIDFSQPQSAAVLTNLAKPIGITANGGDGALVLSTITLITQSECNTAVQAKLVSFCVNNGQYVFTAFFVFGNQTYATTQLGSPNSKYLRSGTVITEAQYLTDASLVATNFGTLLPFPNTAQSGQYAYASEVTLASQHIVFSSFPDTGSYARSIF